MRFSVVSNIRVALVFCNLMWLITQLIAWLIKNINNVYGVEIIIDW
jgi:hypothetical protein